ncbi:MAG TPA: DUF6519 domain-containing protein [Thermoanaerobaculia bacterium]|jgi:hypothetical protein|nr:DUF6519 domain-containing protein [Thermoanaerobaculia bacterium]
MQGDYSRVTFDPRRHFSMVLMQQGRVLLDADYNEQTAILLYYLRTLAADVIGPHGGPANDLGFEIALKGSSANIMLQGWSEQMAKLTIGAGRYWVDGFLCENEAEVTYSDQQKADLSKLAMPLLAYLDVWERHVTSVEDPRIREVALGGPDTSARVKIVWRVRFVSVETPTTTPLDCLHFETSNQWKKLIANVNPGMLTASTDQGTPPATPCIAPPDAQYRGENQLYRVEIHDGGPAGTATFKWSRENASVVFPIESIADALVTVEHLGRDDRFGLEIGDYVEVVDDDTSLDAQSAPEKLFEVKDIDTTELIVTLSGAPNAGRDDTRHPFLRRWDQQAGNPEHHGLTLTDGAAKIEENKLLNLEDGIQIRFEPLNAVYRPGDYWLIPARATGDIEWPGGPQPPHGVTHHYAPLGIVVNVGGVLSVTDLRHRIDPLATCCPKITVKADTTKTDFVTFIAVVDPSLSDLTYQWTIDGKVQTGTAKEIAVKWSAAATRIKATVLVDGLPDGCPDSASATAMRKLAVSNPGDTNAVTE